MYGVSMPLKKPLAAVCIASGITGAFAGFMHLSAFAFATPSLVSFPQFIGAEGNNLVLAVVTGVIAMVLSFLLTWVFGFEDPADETENAKGQTGSSSHVNEKEDDNIQAENSRLVNAAAKDTSEKMIYAPLTGEAVSLGQVNDETFSAEMLGKGMAVIPSQGKVYAPFDGKAETVFPTKHALGLKSDQGVELLIHVGLETVALNGKYFTSHIQDGQRVKQGELILEFDLEGIKSEGYDIVTPIIVTNSGDYSEVVSLSKGKVQKMEPVLEVK